MPKVVKNVSFSWEWTGDERLLQGFNVALCKSTETPLTAITASSFIAMRGTSETPVTLTPSYIFSNVLLDEGVYYIPFVQAVYPGDDSEWLGSTGVLVDDDGTATVAMSSTLPETFFTAAPDNAPTGKYGDSWIKSDSSEWRHNGTTWVEGKYGQDGVNGTRTAILEMYQGAVSIPTTFPSGSSTYTWATGQFTAPATPNSWELTPPALDAGETLWICRTVYADTGTSATTAITWPATNYARAASSNGADGNPGRRTAVLEVYKWLVTGTSSFTYPSGDSTYTWATGAFTLPATPNSWSLLPGAATEGYTLFACRVVYSDILESDTSSIPWTSVSAAYAVGVAGTNGVSALVGMLTNESHTVAALVTGLGYSLTTAGGTFKVYSGVTDVTTSSTFSISGGTDGGTSWTKVQNGLTFTINETTGVYSLSGASWSTTAESFTVIGTYGGAAISKVYTISKSLAGAVGAAANVVTVTGEQAFKFLTGSATPVSTSITLTAVLNGSLTTYDWEYWTGSAWANLSGTQTSNTYTLAYNNAAWGSATALRVRCLSGTVFDEITVVKLYDGATGPSGNSTYTATIYKQVASDPGSPVATASTYNFATGVLTPPSGWVVVQPATTTTPTYACEYTFSGLPSATVYGIGNWGATRIDAVAGAAGNGGVSVAVVEMYKVGGGTLPTGTRFTFSTGLVSGTLNGWSQTMPVSTSESIYMTTCRFTATAPVDFQDNSSWTTAIIVSQLALVGGRNFALNSSLMTDYNLWTSNGGATFPGTGVRIDTTTAYKDITQDIALRPSTTYTVSFDVVDCSALAQLRAYVVEYASPGVLTTPSNANDFTPTTLGRNFYTITTGATCTLGRLYLRVLAGNYFGIYKHYQIEEGNKASSWREAPEDVDARVTTAQDTADDAQDTADTAVTNAATANSLLADIAADSKLTPVEKSAVRAEWDVIAAEKSVNNTQASNFSITTENTTYNTKFQALATYLNAGTTWSSGIPSWISDANLGTTTTIVGATFRTSFKEYYDARTGLLNAIATKAATLAIWSSVSGAGRPSDNATAGSYLVNSNFLGGLSGWTASRDGDPATISTITGTLITDDTDFGICGEFNWLDGAGENVLPKQVVPVTPARIYKISSTFKLTALPPDGVDSWNIVVEGQTLTYTIAGVSMGSGVNVTTINTVTSVSALCSTSAISGVLQLSASAKYFRAGLRHNSVETAAGTLRVGSVLIEDVTDAFNAQVAADAAQSTADSKTDDTAVTALAETISGSGINILGAKYSSFEQTKAPTFTTVGGTATIESVGRHSLSTKSLRLTSTSSANYAYFGTSSTDYNTKINTGKKYIASAWVRCSLASKTGYFYLKTSAGVLYNVSFTTSSTAAAWTRVSGVLDLSADVTSTSVLPSVQNSGGSGVNMWFDDIMIEEQVGIGTTPSAYVEPVWSITDEVHSIISGINLPTTGMQTGLNITQGYLGYYNGSAWKSYIASDGKFLFEGNATNKIGWDGSTLAIQGALVTDGSITGTTLQTEIAELRGIKIKSTGTDAGIKAYDTSGNVKVSIGIDGSATFTGSITGSTITGSTITGSTIKTSSTTSFITMTSLNTLEFHSPAGISSLYSNGSSILIDALLESNFNINATASGRWNLSWSGSDPVGVFDARSTGRVGILGSSLTGVGVKGEGTVDFHASGSGIIRQLTFSTARKLPKVSLSEVGDTAIITRSVDTQKVFLSINPSTGNKTWRYVTDGTAVDAGTYVTPE